MPEKIIHPGLILDNMLNDKGLSQRDLASKIDVAQSLLNNILNGNRNININLAISLENAGFKTALFWLSHQMNYSLSIAKKEEDVIKKAEAIKTWNEIDEIVPLSYFKKQEVGISSPDDINKVYEVYDVKNFDSLKKKIAAFNPTYFRKSSKFVENKNNVIAWSVLAKYKAKEENVPVFKRSYEKDLLNDLKRCFYKNHDVITKSKSILNKYGIKFFTLSRPPQTPVDGKSFVSDNNPAIVLTLKYKRLDNFAYSLFHELGHVFSHLTNPNHPELSKEEFFINSSSNALVEFEADNYARNNLIDQVLWNDFVTFNDEFSDDVILDFSKAHKVHPGIVRGRICYENNEYYSKRSVINEMNKLDI